MKVIEALRYCHADWVVFVDLDKTGSEAFSKKMKVKNITWDRLRPVSYTHLDVYKRQIHSNPPCILIIRGMEYFYKEAI